MYIPVFFSTIIMRFASSIIINVLYYALALFLNTYIYIYMNKSSQYLDLFIIVIFLLTGSNVQVPSEVILLNAMVLPDKSLGGSCKNQIIL